MLKMWQLSSLDTVHDALDTIITGHVGLDSGDSCLCSNVLVQSFRGGCVADWSQDFSLGPQGCDDDGNANIACGADDENSLHNEVANYLGFNFNVLFCLFHRSP